MHYIEQRCVEHIDTDASGVVHFSRYAGFYETVLLNFICKHTSACDYENFIHRLRVIQLQINFILPSMFADVLHIEMSLLKKQQVMFQLGFLLHTGNVELPRNKAKLTFCYVDKNNKATRIPGLISTLLGEMDVCCA